MIRDPKRINELAEHILAYANLYNIKCLNKNQLSIEVDKLLLHIKKDYKKNPETIEIAEDISMIDLEEVKMICDIKTEYIEQNEGAIAINTSNGILISYCIILVGADGLNNNLLISEDEALKLEQSYFIALSSLE